MIEQVHLRDIIYLPFRVKGKLKMIMKPAASILSESPVMSGHVILGR